MRLGKPLEFLLNFIRYEAGVGVFWFHEIFQSISELNFLLFLSEKLFFFYKLFAN